MAARTISMEHYNMILRLQELGFSIKGIARQLGLARNTIRRYLSDQGGDSPPDDTAAPSSSPRIGLPLRVQQLHEHFSYAERELKKTGVTRQMLWLEYKDIHPDGFQYSHYCYHFQQYLRTKDVVMHLEHKPGNETMIDFAGKKLSYVDLPSGELIECQVFVSVMPHSGLIYVQAVHSQKTADFVSCINGMCQYYGGLSRSILCDNLKTAVVSPSKYEPVFTEVCYQLSEHYNTCFTATRPYKPRDKAMVERAVSIVYTHVYAPLRNETFHSLKALNLSIRTYVDALNLHPYKGSGYCRRDLFNAEEASTLLPLPSHLFAPKNCVQATVQRNYHVLLGEDKHYYSVPFSYTGKKVKVLYDTESVEIYLSGERIACHQRQQTRSRYHTLPDHMPKSHSQAVNFRGWSEEELLSKAMRIGPHTQEAARRILVSSIYPPQNFKACHGMIILHKKYGIARLEAACCRALGGSRVNYTMIRNILEKGLDQQVLTEQSPSLPDHQNIRGANHYV